MYLLAISTLSAVLSGADPAAAYASLPICTLSADGTRLAVEPCRTAPPKRRMPRRPVPQLIVPTPRVASPTGPSWAPVLTAPTPPATVSRSSPATPPPSPSAPIPVTCDAAGCRDANGTFYHGPPGQVISPSGKMCSNNGVWLQCF